MLFRSPMVNAISLLAWSYLCAFSGLRNVGSFISCHWDLTGRYLLVCAIDLCRSIWSPCRFALRSGQLSELIVFREDRSRLSLQSPSLRGHRVPGAWYQLRERPLSQTLIATITTLVAFSRHSSTHQPFYGLTVVANDEVTGSQLRLRKNNDNITDMPFFRVVSSFCSALVKVRYQ